MTDRELADIMVGCYAYDGQPYPFDVLHEENDVYAGIKHFPDVDVVCFRGSVTFEDWIRDAMAFVPPCEHCALGPVHPGARIGIDEVWAFFKPNLRPGWIGIGHSLGAMRVDIFSGLAVLDGLPPSLYVRWGEPKPGFQQLADILAQIPAGRSYRNGGRSRHDYVTDVPFTIGFEQYVHPQRLIHVQAEPPADDAYGVFSYHHMPLYQQAMG